MPALELLVACGLVALLACKENSFSAGGGKTEAGKPANSRGGQDSGPEDGDDGKDGEDGKAGKGGDGPGGSDSGGQDADIGASDAAGPGSIGDTTDQGGAGLATSDDCLASKADNYNFLLIFDNSGSQKETDPTAVRRDGALAFVDKFADYVRRNRRAVVRFGVLAFNSASIRVSPGWLKVQDDQLQQIKDQITQATSNPDGATAYSPVLKDAATFYAALEKERRKVKNYVIFLTDGEPNAADSRASLPVIGGLFGGGQEQLTDIPPAVDALVRNYDVAMIAIAAGPSISSEGEQLTRSLLAKPEVGTKDPKHVGIYQRARTPEDLKQVWEQLFSKIGSCD